MKKKIVKMTAATLVGGLAMWIIAGLWHNLILPTVNTKIKAHHDGIIIMLIAYFMLALLIAYVYSHMDFSDNTIVKGLKTGIIIGIIWVLPHGLTMAGAHNTSIVYEFKNALYHIFEQGVGGIIIALVMEFKNFNTDS